MIKLKELTNRRYEDKKPIAFDYRLEVGKDELQRPVTTLFQFQRLDPENNTWMLKTQFGRTAQADTQCYYIGIEVPKNDVPLELICAIGLHYFRQVLQSEIQLRSNIDFSIGEAIEGM